MTEITCKCGQLMADFDVRVAGGEFVREWYCFHCGAYALVPEPPTGAALVDTASGGVVTETYEPLNDTQPLLPRETEAGYFSRFRGDE